MTRHMHAQLTQATNNHLQSPLYRMSVARQDLRGTPPAARVLPAPCRVVVGVTMARGGREGNACCQAAQLVWLLSRPRVTPSRSRDDNDVADEGHTASSSNPAGTAVGVALVRISGYVRTMVLLPDVLLLVCNLQAEVMRCALLTVQRLGY